MKKLRVAIIGQGRSGMDIHVNNILALPKMFEIAAIVDPWKVRRDRGVEELKCDGYKDYKPLLKRKDIDLVVNASPSHFHVPITLDLFKAGLNVLTEKPLTRKVKDVDKLMAAAEKSGSLFAIYQQSRYAAYFEQVKKVIASGVLGRIVQISICFSGYARRWDQQTVTAKDGGNLMNTGPHPLDLALRLMDLPLDTMPDIFCCMDRAHFFGDAEGHVNLTMRGPKAPIIDLEISSCKAYPTFLYQVYGTQGGMKANPNDAEWRYFIPSESPKHRAEAVPIHNEDCSPAYCGETLKWYTRKWKVPPTKKDLFQSTGTSFYKMLYKHILKGESLEITPEQVRQQIAVIEECHRQNPHIWGKNGK